ncbi:hypothetical protein [uncultured Aquimarina sp.]|uniref:hypothetical protein n=1 Tax=uncultured Aquimarina sp. TaxID=575652 RepID=UPI00260BF247|nr:hypothetical protein [uncultured Aquimarina sp.]
MINTYQLNFGLIEIYDDYIKSIINEGITITPKHNNVLLEMVEKHFKNKPFLYITHRINSYAVDPTIYLETTKICNLLGFAVVSKDPLQEKQIKLEQAFFSKELKRFDDMESALIWKDELLQDYSNSLV